MPKELPCPHCGQDIHIPARYNADEVSRLERIKEAAVEIEKLLDPMETDRAHTELRDALHSTGQK